MTQIAKLHAWTPANPRASIPFRDFERLILPFGWALLRTTGSHRQYGHPTAPIVISMPRGKDAKSYQVQQFIAICKEYGLRSDA